MNSFYDDLLKMRSNNDLVNMGPHEIRIIDEQERDSIFRYEQEIKQEKDKLNNESRQYSFNGSNCIFFLDGFMNNNITNIHYAQASKHLLKNQTYIFNNYIDGYNAIEYPVSIKLYGQCVDEKNESINKYSYIFIMGLDFTAFDTIYCKAFKNLNKLISYNCIDGYTPVCPLFSDLYMAQPIETKQVFYNKNNIYNNQEELVKFKMSVLNKTIIVNENIYTTIKNLGHESNFSLFEGIILTILKQEYNNKKVKCNE